MWVFLLGNGCRGRRSRCFASFVGLNLPLTSCCTARIKEAAVVASSEALRPSLSRALSAGPRLHRPQDIFLPRRATGRAFRLPGGGAPLGQEPLGFLGSHAVLVPHPAEEVGQFPVAFPLGVSDVGIVGGAAPEGVEEHPGEVVDGVRVPVALSPSAMPLFSSSFAFTARTRRGVFRLGRSPTRSADARGRDAYRSDQKGSAIGARGTARPRFRTMILSATTPSLIAMGCFVRP